MQTYSGSDSLQEVLLWWDEARNADGGICPCCKQVFKNYSRKLNAGMVFSLIRVFRENGFAWVDTSDYRIEHPDVDLVHLEFHKLRFWGLIEQSGADAAVWRVTKRGCDFIHGLSREYAAVVLYNGNLLGADGEKTVNVSEALGKKFSLEELMQPAKTPTREEVG
jgi:hypothetical protein